MKCFFEIKNYIIKHKNIIFTTFLLIILSFIGILNYYICENNKKIKKDLDKQISLNIIKEENSDKEILEVDEENYVYVDIKGYVKNPGVYKVESDKRINDVIAIAGGLIKYANTKYVNLSKKITDEMVINIYSDQEIKKMMENNKEIKPTTDKIDENSIEDKNENSNLININIASETELMTLSGIGEVKAKAIIDYRNEFGKFNTIEDILKVSGISESTYSKIKTLITV